MRTKWWMMLVAILLVTGMTGVTQAATVSFSREDERVSADAAADGAPENGYVANFFVTTDADILSVGKVLIDVEGGEIFNVPCEGLLGCSDFSGPPRTPCFTCHTPAFLPASPAELVDTGITTPGPTSLLGADFPGDGLTTTLGDLSNDGPQNMFQFARITVSQTARATFSGKISVAGATGPEDFPFSFAIGVPEPSSLLLMGIGLMCVCGPTRR